MLFLWILLTFHQVLAFPSFSHKILKYDNSLKGHAVKVAHNGVNRTPTTLFSSSQRLSSEHSGFSQSRDVLIKQMVPHVPEKSLLQVAARLLDRMLTEGTIDARNFDFYVLDSLRQPVKSSAAEALNFIAKRENYLPLGLNIVGSNMIDGYYINTVFLPIDHNHNHNKISGENRPILFETKVSTMNGQQSFFLDDSNKICFHKRCCTFDEAMKMHGKVCNLISHHGAVENLTPEEKQLIVDAEFGIVRQVGKLANGVLVD